MATDQGKSRKKPLKGIKSSTWTRGFGLAKLSVNAGLQLAGHGLTQMFADPSERAAGRLDMLKAQANLLANELHKLKGSMMKVGQMLSMYGEHFLPDEAGLLVADRYDAAIRREALLRPLAPARRKAEWLNFARRAARRLSAQIDPTLGFGS